MEPLISIPNTSQSASSNPTAAWPMVELSDADCFTWTSGLWTGKNPPYTRINVVRNTNFARDGQLDCSDIAQIEIESRNLPAKQLLPGDIVLERSGGGPKQPVGRVAFFDIPDGVYSYSNFTSRLRIRDKQKCDAQFVHLFLHHFHASGGTLTLQQNTTGIRNLRFGDYLKTLIPTPRLPEQRAIASTLGKLLFAINVEEKRIAHLRELKSATLAQILREGLRREELRPTALGELPASWRLLPLGSMSRIGNGSTPNRQNEAYWQDGSIPWITSSKVHDIFIRDADEFVTELALRQCHLPLVPAGSIVIAITGQGKTLGNVAMTMLDTCINQHLAFAQITSDDVVPEFLLYYLQSRYSDLRSVGFGGGSTKGALTCGFLKTYPIPLPAVSEQREIASIITKLSERVGIAIKRRSLLRELFSAALDQLMSGQLSVAPLLEQATNIHA